MTPLYLMGLNGDPFLKMGITRCIFQIAGQQPSYKRRLHIRVNGAANTSVKCFKIAIDILSWPVAVSLFNFLKIFLVQRLRKGMKSSQCVSAWPKKGVSTTSSGNSFLAVNTFANAFAFPLASKIHVFSSRSGGIELIFIFRCINSRFILHHCLLLLDREDNFSFSLLTYFCRSSRSISEQILHLLS